MNKKSIILTTFFLAFLPLSFCSIYAMQDQNDFEQYEEFGEDNYLDSSSEQEESGEDGDEQKEFRFQMTQEKMHKAQIEDIKKTEDFNNHAIEILEGANLNQNLREEFRNKQLRISKTQVNQESRILCVLYTREYPRRNVMEVIDLDKKKILMTINDVEDFFLGNTGKVVFVVYMKTNDISINQYSGKTNQDLDGQLFNIETNEEIGPKIGCSINGRDYPKMFSKKDSFVCVRRKESSLYDNTFTIINTKTGKYFNLNGYYYFKFSSNENFLILKTDPTNLIYNTRTGQFLKHNEFVKLKNDFLVLRDKDFINNKITEIFKLKDELEDKKEFETQDNKEIFNLEEFGKRLFKDESGLCDVKLSQDGNALVSCEMFSGNARLINTNNKAQKSLPNETFRCKFNKNNELAIASQKHKSGKFLFSTNVEQEVDFSKKLNLQDAETAKFSNTGKYLLLEKSDGSIDLVSCDDNMKEIINFPNSNIKDPSGQNANQNEDNLSMRSEFSPNDEFLVITTPLSRNTGHHKLICTRTNKIIFEWQTNTQNLWEFCLTDNLLAIEDENGELKVYKITNGKEIKNLKRNLLKTIETAKEKLSKKEEPEEEKKNTENKLRPCDKAFCDSCVTCEF